MGIDSDDRLLREGIGLNDNHEKKVQERLISKPFLTMVIVLEYLTLLLLMNGSIEQLERP